jgi:ATP-dependent RNA helicase DDX55/SPB4
MFSATLQGMQQKNFEFFGMRNLAKISLKAIDTNKVQNVSAVQPEKVKGYVIPKSLQNTYIVMKDRLEKINFLISFLHENMGKEKIIVFLSTCACVDYYTKLLELYFKNFPELKNNIFGIHGKLKTRRRKRIIEEFLGKTNGVLFATDVVSRGIDF